MSLREKLFIQISGFVKKTGFVPDVGYVSGNRMMEIIHENEMNRDVEPLRRMIAGVEFEGVSHLGDNDVELVVRKKIDP